MINNHLYQEIINEIDYRPLLLELKNMSEENISNKENPAPLTELCQRH
jgi:hypothetical protein